MIIVPDARQLARLVAEYRTAQGVSRRTVAEIAAKQRYQTPEVVAGLFGRWERGEKDTILSSLNHYLPPHGLTLALLTAEEVAGYRAGQLAERLAADADANYRDKFDEGNDQGRHDPVTHRCSRCGSDRWVGWRAGPDRDLPRYAQCVPCGKVGDRIGEYE